MKQYANHARMYAGHRRWSSWGRVWLRRPRTSRTCGRRTFPEDLKRWLGAESSIAKQASADALAESVARKVASSALALGLQLNQRRGKPKGLER